MKIDRWIAENFESDDEVLITGTTSGIGFEYAKAFAELGCNLVCVSNEDEALQVQKQKLERDHGIAVTNIHLDLRDIHKTNEVAETLAERRIKVLVNNAGFGLKGRFEKHDNQEYIDIIAVNAIAPVLLTRSILPNMQKKNRGVIIHVASINAIVPIPNNQVYTATKAFCSSYASAVGRENKLSNICFQLVLPGTTKTPFHDRQGANPKSLVMLPEDVVKASLDNITRGVCIPNPADRLLFKLVPLMPKNFAMDLASYLLKKRLGV